MNILYRAKLETDNETDDWEDPYSPEVFVHEYGNGPVPDRHEVAIRWIRDDTTDTVKTFDGSSRHEAVAFARGLKRGWELCSENS